VLRVISGSERTKRQALAYALVNTRTKFALIMGVVVSGGPGSLAQRFAQASGVHTPIAVQYPVDEDDRDLVTVRRLQARHALDRVLLPSGSGVAAHRRNDVCGVVAQVATGLAKDYDSYAFGRRHLARERLGLGHAAQCPTPHPGLK
jgi:hypothetical protein